MTVGKLLKQTDKKTNFLQYVHKGKAGNKLERKSLMSAIFITFSEGCGSSFPHLGNLVSSSPCKDVSHFAFRVQWSCCSLQCFWNLV